MNKGFTLLEVLIALLILAFSMVVLVESWGGNFRAVQKARKYTVVTMLLQKKVTEFEILSRDKKFDEIKDEDKGDFGHDYPEYTWEMKSRPFEIPNIFPASDKQNKMTEMIVKGMMKYFEEAVKEVVITVVYKSGKSVQKYSVSTLYVDYNKELPDVGSL